MWNYRDNLKSLFTSDLCELSLDNDKLTEQAIFALKVLFENSVLYTLDYDYLVEKLAIDCN